MTRLVKRYVAGQSGLKKLLPLAWQTERIQRHEKLLKLQASVNASLSAGNLQQASDLCVRFVSEYPGERAGYKVLGQVLEGEGDTATATQCFNAQLPVIKQDELFGTDINSLNVKSSSVFRVTGHKSEQCQVRVDWSRQSQALQQFKRDKLCAVETQTLALENGCVWHDGYNTVPFNNEGKPIIDFVIGNVAPVMVNVSKRRPRRIQGDVVLLGARGTNNYFHWMTDILPKLEILKKSGVAWDKHTRFVFRNVTKPFQINTLEQLGIGRSQWLETTNGQEYISAKRIIIPQLENKMCLTMGSWVSEFLKRVFLDSDLNASINTESIKPSTTTKLFISRDPAAAQGRDIANADDVSAFFKERGFQVIYPEQYSITEQAALFSSASYIAAPHGAGLANLHFCSPGTRVLEFHGAHYSPCYWALSEKLGLRYDNLDCSLKEDSAASRLDAAKTLDKRRGQGFSIALDKLDALLGQQA